MTRLDEWDKILDNLYNSSLFEKEDDASKQQEEIIQTISLPDVFDKILETNDSCKECGIELIHSVDKLFKLCSKCENTIFYSRSKAERPSVNMVIHGAQQLGACSNAWGVSLQYNNHSRTILGRSFGSDQFLQACAFVCGLLLLKQSCVVNIIAYRLLFNIHSSNGLITVDNGVFPERIASAVKNHSIFRVIPEKGSFEEVSLKGLREKVVFDASRLKLDSFIASRI